VAVDLQVVFPQESIVLNDIRVERYDGFWAVRVEGEDFRAVDEVSINELASPDVIVLSKTLLVAQLPDLYQKVPEVRSVAVLSNRLTLSPRSLIRFRISKSPGRVRGILRLVQLFLKILFTTPGTDIFRPGSGGGILRQVGETFGQSEGSNIVTDMVIAVNRTQRQLISMQSRDQRSPRDERLLSAKVLSSSFDKLQSAFYITVEIVSQAGRTAVTNLEL
jgi:hypothetical protein